MGRENSFSVLLIDAGPVNFTEQRMDGDGNAENQHKKKDGDDDQNLPPNRKGMTVCGICVSRVSHKNVLQIVSHLIILHLTG